MVSSPGSKSMIGVARKVNGRRRRMSSSCGRSISMEIRVMDHILTALSRLPNTRHAFSASPTRSIVEAPSEKLRQEQAAEAKRAYFDAIRQPVAFKCDTCRDLLSVETLPGSGVFRPCPDCSGPRQSARLQSICGMTEAEMR